MFRSKINSDKGFQYKIILALKKPNTIWLCEIDLENSKKIDMNNIDEVRNSLESKSLKVCVVGIGRIGLPTALSFAKAGLQTIGVDINE